MVSVIDKETREPVARAFFIHDGDTLAYTSLQGIAKASLVFALASFVGSPLAAPSVDLLTR